MQKSIPEQFFEKLKKKQLSEDDHLRLKDWLQHASQQEVNEVLDKFGWYFENLPDEPYPADGRLASLIENAIDHHELQPAIIPNAAKKRIIPFALKSVGIAASVILVCYAVLFFKQNKKAVVNAPVARVAKKIVPGGNKAILTLADGSAILLDSAKNGLLAQQNNAKVIKSKNGQLVYNASANNPENSAALVYNTITTPRGGQYQVTLPDGSKVWLNAQSSLKFPTSFTGAKREVTLTGEGYFEVAKNKAHPFIVSINDNKIEVLGTHFNVMGYSDETATRTTLLEGSVKVTKGKAGQMIVPGEQAIVADKIEIARVNVDEAVEWKNGNFNFSHENLRMIMRKISRWYDVDISYQGKTPGSSFVGTIPRSQNIGEVLKYLELTGLVHFKIVERSVVVMP